MEDQLELSVLMHLQDSPSAKGMVGRKRERHHDRDCCGEEGSRVGRIQAEVERSSVQSQLQKGR